MMKYILITPAVIIMVLTFTSQMVSMAETTQAKTVSYVDDMNNALDCAFKGVDLRVCSPNLYDYDFKGDINATIRANQEFMQGVEGQEESGGIIYVQEGELNYSDIRYVLEDDDGNLIVVMN
jgi:hypothetical protein